MTEKTEKRLVTVNRCDIYDITTGEVIQTYRYNLIELIATGIVLCDGDERNVIFEFNGYR